MPVGTAWEGCVVEFRRLRRVPLSSRRRLLLWEGPLAANSELRIEFRRLRRLPRGLGYPRIPTTTPVMEVSRFTAVPLSVRRPAKAHALQGLWCQPRIWSAELQFRLNVGALAPRAPAVLQLNRARQ